MPLEQKFVFELLDEGKSKQEVLDTIEGMRELDVNMNSKAVEKSLKKYEFQQKYTNFKKNRKNVRRNAKRKATERLNEMVSEKIEELKEKPEVLSVKVKETQSLNNCSFCNSIRFNYISAKIHFIKKINNVYFEEKTKTNSLFYFCYKCYSIFDDRFNIL